MAGKLIKENASIKRKAGALNSYGSQATRQGGYLSGAGASKPKPTMVRKQAPKKK